jgi:predicted SAM-dependent methyltransferase
MCTIAAMATVTNDPTAGSRHRGIAERIIMKLAVCFNRQSSKVSQTGAPDPSQASWNEADGRIGRSFRFDTRNSVEALGMVSIIVDAKKP